MAKPKTISCYLGIKSWMASVSQQRLCSNTDKTYAKRVLKVKTWKENTSLLCNQTFHSQVSAAGHRRMIQNSPRKVSNHSKWLLLLLNSIWGFNSEWQQFGAWSTRAGAQQRDSSTWTEALISYIQLQALQTGQNYGQVGSEANNEITKTFKPRLCHKTDLL